MKLLQKVQVSKPLTKEYVCRFYGRLHRGSAVPVTPVWSEGDWLTKTLSYEEKAT